MKDNKVSDTYASLYNFIIGDLLSNICKENKHICIRSDEIPYIIGEYFDEYKSKAIKNMESGRLDRHKLASCMCGAIIAAEPLTGLNGAKIKNNSNELLALYACICLIKYYLVYSYVHPLNLPQAKEEEVISHLLKKFSMQFPENICDEQDYYNNLLNSLYWTHQHCEQLGKMCFQYDIWAYSTIFYHFEVYNQTLFKEIFQDYITTNKEAVGE